MSITSFEIAPEHVGDFLSMTAHPGRFNPDSDVWLMRWDLEIAQRRYGRHADREIAEYLRPGREDWGPL